jgi:hypothetical protein
MQGISSSRRFITEEMNGLYQHSKIKALVSTAHGEVMASLFLRQHITVSLLSWLGGLDSVIFSTCQTLGERVARKSQCLRLSNMIFKMFNQRRFGIMLSSRIAMAFPREASFKRRLREVRSEYSRFKRNAKKLQKYLIENFTEELMCRNFTQSVLSGDLGTPVPVGGISFCISTNGAKPDKTSLEIMSIHKCMESVETPYEIIVAGDVENFKNNKSVKIGRNTWGCTRRPLAKLRNNAAEEANYDTIIFVDDDFVFPLSWAENFLEYSEKNPWKVLGNKILLPDGSRFWDRSTMRPHKLVSYEYPEYSKNLYQTGGFWIMRRDTYESHKWNSSLEINAEKEVS